MFAFLFSSFKSFVQVLQSIRPLGVTLKNVWGLIFYEYAI